MNLKKRRVIFRLESSLRITLLKNRCTEKIVNNKIRSNFLFLFYGFKLEIFFIYNKNFNLSSPSAYKLEMNPNMIW